MQHIIEKYCNTYTYAYTYAYTYTYKYTCNTYVEMLIHADAILIHEILMWEKSCLLTFF